MDLLLVTLFAGRCEVLVVRFVDQFATSSPFDSFLWHQSPAPLDSLCKQQRGKKKAGPRRGLILYMHLLCFNQHTKRHLIRLLMRLLRSPISLRPFTLFGLKKKQQPPLQLEDGVDLQSPCTHWLLQIALAMTNLISCSTGDGGRGPPQKKGTYAHTEHTCATHHYVGFRAHWLLLR